jgi:autotransporter-associated beta strand protein
MRDRPAVWVVLVLAALVPLLPARPAFAATDITADIRAGRNVTLTGDAVVTVPPGSTTYAGTIGGSGTLTFRGSGTLVLTRDSDFTLPAARHRETVSTNGGNHPYYTINNPDPPAITVTAGVTLQYGTGGATGFLGHFPYRTPGVTLNGLNIRVDGRLTVDVTVRRHLGVMSGAGFIVQPRNTWPGLDLAGDHPFTGVIYNGTGIQAGATTYLTYLRHERKLLNQGSVIVDEPMNQRMVLGMDFYNREWGSDINFHSRGTGVVVMTGVYSWADTGPDWNPSLSDPSLNFVLQPHLGNKRGINIEGASVQWGDGTGSRFFLPGTVATMYINMHQARNRSRLGFDYNGPVTLGGTISGGRFNNTMTDPGQGDVVIMGTRGNDVTFAAPQNYNGSTTVESGATLRLGSGAQGGDGSLLASAPLYRIVDNGTLVLHNAATALSLSRISGSGSLTQSGPAAATLTGQIGYTGATRVTGGRLALRGASLGASSGVTLTAAGAVLDLTQAGNQTIRDLSGAAGTLRLGHTTVTTGTGTSTTFGGAVTGDGAGVVKVGAGVLTLTGHSATPGGTWQVRQGGLRLPGQGSLRVGGYTQAPGGTLVLAPAGPGPAGSRLAVSGAVTLAGALRVEPGAVPAGARQLTVVDHAGRAAVSGTFDGLAEGATLAVAGITYHISYRGGDGNDVVLSSDTAAPAAAGGPAHPLAARAAGGGHLLWTVAAALVLVLLGAVLFLVLLCRAVCR